MKYFLWLFSPFRWFKEGSCQFLTKECTQVLVNHLEGRLTWRTKPSQEKVPLGRMTALDMTLMG